MALERNQRRWRRHASACAKVVDRAGGGAGNRRAGWMDSRCADPDWRAIRHPDAARCDPVVAALRLCAVPGGRGDRAGTIRILPARNGDGVDRGRAEHRRRRAPSAGLWPDDRGRGEAAGYGVAACVVRSGGREWRDRRCSAATRTARANACLSELARRARPGPGYRAGRLWARRPRAARHAHVLATGAVRDPLHEPADPGGAAAASRKRVDGNRLPIQSIGTDRALVPDRCLCASARDRRDHPGGARAGSDQISVRLWRRDRADRRKSCRHRHPGRRAATARGGGRAGDPESAGRHRREHPRFGLCQGQARPISAGQSPPGRDDGTQ